MRPVNIKNNFWRFIGLLLIQVWILNNPFFLSALNFKSLSIFIPMVYPLFISLLPFNISRSTLLTLSFVLGLIIDISSNTIGIHIIACVTIGFFRDNIINFLNISPALKESNNTPNLQNLGFLNFNIYIGMLILIHNFIFFSLSSFAANNIFYVIFRTLASGLLSIMIINFLMIFFYQRKNDLKSIK